MRENNENLKVLQTKDLMKYLKIGKDRAYALMRQNGFPSIKIGKTFIVTQEALETWLKNNEGRSINI